MLLSLNSVVTMVTYVVNMVTNVVIIKQCCYHGYLCC